MTEWFGLFASHRVARAPGEEIVQGILHSDLRADDPPVREALDRWDGTHFIRSTPLGTEITLVRRISPRPRERWWLHALLFLATALTTTVAGALFASREPLAFVSFPLGTLEIPLPLPVFPGQLVPGLAFSVPLLTILLAHELGHYLVGRRRGMDASPPYFIPAPVWINLIGTFGAFIRLRSPMVNRAVLLDVGSAGPLASFVLSIPAAAWGLRLSGVGALPADAAPGGYAALFAGEVFWLGGSLVFDALAALFAPGGGVVVLHPLALAGWLGFFVTALNLFPLAQLDGGHVLYALVGERQRYVGLAFLGVLLALGFDTPWWEGWWGWWFWAVLVLALGRGSIGHPPVFDPYFPVSGVRRAVGWASVAIFLLTFIPFPFRV